MSQVYFVIFCKFCQKFVKLRLINQFQVLSLKEQFLYKIRGFYKKKIITYKLLRRFWEKNIKVKIRDLIYNFNMLIK